MECYRCGTVVDGEDFCPNCGADIGLYRRILAAADACYNDGLEKAQVRDLSGAVESLNIVLAAVSGEKHEKKNNQKEGVNKWKSYRRS